MNLMTNRSKLKSGNNDSKLGSETQWQPLDTETVATIRVIPLKVKTTEGLHGSDSEEEESDGPRKSIDVVGRISRSDLCPHLGRIHKCQRPLDQLKPVGYDITITNPIEGTDQIQILIMIG